MCHTESHHKEDLRPNWLQIFQQQRCSFVITTFIIIILIIVLIIITIIFIIIMMILIFIMIVKEDKVEVATSEFPTLCQRKTYYQVVQ